ncbi:hypothetical protein AAFF_G00190330 [Aldrovandia affinis]|uniref:Uncharacterized protein n=1 Tax=Aldrovandia affinis TaxID=143900 RepID=A0AAD7W686_9TELE|nr:hypothetical protein AAFF_G00190330 [Aldrovandia affinis]
MLCKYHSLKMSSNKEDPQTERLVTRSKQDAEAVQLLEEKTVRVDMDGDNPPDVYEWQVLPLGTTCATFAVQKHVVNHSQPGEDGCASVEHCFYVDNCLQSLPSADEAKKLVDKLKHISAGHLPAESRSESSELWFTQDGVDPQEHTLGLQWQYLSDTLGYKHGQMEKTEPTMRSIYQILASQYNPLGFINPFTTRAKVLVQKLWGMKIEWDDPDLPEDLLQAWLTWENEVLQHSKVLSAPTRTSRPAQEVSASSVMPQNVPMSLSHNSALKTAMDRVAFLAVISRVALRC